MVICEERKNIDSFPQDDVFSRDSLNRFELEWNRVKKRISGLPIIPYQLSAIKQNSVGLIHSHFGQRGWSDLGLKKYLKIPQVTTFYGYDASLEPRRNPVWKERYRQLFEKGDLFLAEGNFLKETLVHLGCPGEKVTIQHLGVDIKNIKFIFRRKTEEMTRVLMVGSFVEKKGIPIALEAIGKVINDGFKLGITIIGDQVKGDKRSKKEKENIFKVIEKYKLNNSTRFLGFVTHEQLLEEAYQHQILIAPSRTASDGDSEGGVPVSIIELSASGMPVLSTRHCDIPEVILDGASGFLVNENDSNALAQKLADLLQKPEQWEWMGKAARKHIENNYNLSEQIDKLETLYDRTLS